MPHQQRTWLIKLWRPRIRIANKKLTNIFFKLDYESDLTEGKRETSVHRTKISRMWPIDNDTIIVLSDSFMIYYTAYPYFG